MAEEETRGEGWQSEDREGHEGKGRQESDVREREHWQV